MPQANFSASLPEKFWHIVCPYFHFRRCGGWFFIFDENCLAFILSVATLTADLNLSKVAIEIILNIRKIENWSKVSLKTLSETIKTAKFLNT